MMEHIIRQVGGHVEVYTAEGVFLFSADNTREAMEELAGWGGRRVEGIRPYKTGAV